MLEGDIYYFTGNYIQVCDAVSSKDFKFSGFYSSDKKHNQEWFDNLVARDMDLGNPFFVGNETEYKSLQTRWKATKIEDIKMYMQGDGMGTFLAGFLYRDVFFAQGNSPESLTNPANLAFGYLDDDNKLSGINIHYSTDKNNPRWVISILANANVSPEEREFHVFTHFPEGIPENLCDKKKLAALHPTRVSNQITSKKHFPRRILPFQKTFKEALNSEKVYLLLENMLNPDGTVNIDYMGEKSLEKRGYKIDNLRITHPPVEKKPEDTVTPSATAVKPKPNANVTAFIKTPEIADRINRAIANRGYALSKDRNFLVNENDQRNIHIGPKGEMTTDPINTGKTPDPGRAIANIFIVMLRTNAVIFSKGGEDNYPSEKTNLNFQQAEGASEDQKTEFIRLEAKVKKYILAEIEENAANYPEAFIAKIQFNGSPLSKKRPAEIPPKDKDEADESEKKHESKRPRL